MRAARYLGVAPWELEEAPSRWMNRALMAEGAEVKAEDAAARRAQRKAR